MSEITYRFSGHQTFPLRIAWLPKAAAEIREGLDPLTNPDDGIERLGLGKNMVDALRCWIDAYQIANHSPEGWTLTPIGDLIFGADGLDPYLEDSSTPWVLHWLIATNRKSPFWAWECLFNRWTSTEFHVSAVLEAFRRQTDQTQKPAAAITLKQHWEVFLHTYRPPQGDTGEDNLDTALGVLRLIQPAGERQNSAGKWENLYAFAYGPKRTLPQQLFGFFLHDWWDHAFPQEQTVPFRDILNSHLSPGRILKMQEFEIAERLTDLASRQAKIFQIVESSNIRQVRRLRRPRGFEEVRSAFRNPWFL